ncbi:MAG: hypothetical protein ISQ73_08020 [Verrucomicrobiae bacterium]|nr:hypothetical protein [Verrucomicrobiae bacterium]
MTFISWMLLGLKWRQDLAAFPAIDTLYSSQGIGHWESQIYMHPQNSSWRLDRILVRDVAETSG